MPVSTNSIETIERCRAWISNCENNHLQCQAFRSPSWRPSRLIDLTTPDKWVLRIDTATLEDRVEYTTISYRWGNVPFIRLTKDTIQEFVNPQPIASLPPTFRDAMELTIRLGFHYIWIDALCIIQGCKEDWLKEGSTMANVYTNSECTLSATAAHDPWGGLFRQRNKDKILTGDLGPYGFRIERFPYVDSFIPAGYSAEEIKNSPLFTRGWILQERLLSRRILHFGEGQVYFDCRVSWKCETFPDGHPRTEIDKLLDRPSPEVSYNFDYQWPDLVEQYSRSALTNSSDKLIALSGIAEIFSRVSNGDLYFAGHWKTRLISTLPWLVLDNTKTVKLIEPLSPSWSWASINGAITFESSGSSCDLLATVVKFPTTPVSPYISKTLPDCTLRLRGTAERAQCIDKDELFSTWTCSCHQTTLRIHVRLDYSMPGFSIGAKLTFFPLTVNRAAFLIQGIVIRLIHGYTNRYQRVGAFFINIKQIEQQHMPFRFGRLKIIPIKTISTEIGTIATAIIPPKEWRDIELT